MLTSKLHYCIAGQPYTYYIVKLDSVSCGSYAEKPGFLYICTMCVLKLTGPAALILPCRAKKELLLANAWSGGVTLSNVLTIAMNQGIIRWPSMILIYRTIGHLWLAGAHIADLANHRYKNVKWSLRDLSNILNKPTSALI